jgi:hypothetical protein
MNRYDFKKGYQTDNIEEFVQCVFPDEWKAVGARIIESGAEFTPNCTWAARWSKIPMTVRVGKTEDETILKSCIYRIHDCLHQLWGLPVPTGKFSEDEFYLFKRAAMCGEVAVLTLTEFVFADFVYQTFPEYRDCIWERNAIPLKVFGPLKNKTTVEIAMRLDGLLHKKIRPRWVRESDVATRFCDDYVPMLEGDRSNLDQHWKSMKDADWIPTNAPNCRYDSNLDGLELTIWMIEDFEHLLRTDNRVDEALMRFNRERRGSITLPDNWFLTE